jgi:vancomycin aglycone glucosyltransferase
MRVMLSSYGSRGDVEPLAGLGVALQALGADVVVSTPPDQEFVELLARARVPFVPAFMGVRDWVAWARESGLKLPGFAAKMMPSQYDAINAHAAGCDAIVATGLFPSVAAAQCVAEKRGLHYEQAVLCPLSLPSHHHRPFPRPGYPLPPDVTDMRALWALNAQHMDAIFGEAVNTQRALVGLRKVDNVRDHVFTDHPLLASDPVLWPWLPTDLCHPAHTGAWVLPDERPLPAGLSAFLEAGAPPIYVGFGSIAVQGAEDVARAAIQAIRTQGCRAVLARGWAELALIDDQDDCFLVGEVNQQALFRRVAVVVHHGGAGTTTTAALAGVPQVIVPQIVDQPYWAAQVAALGVGVAHDGPTPTCASLSAALQGALTPETRAHATAVAGMMRSDGAMAAAELLLDAVDRRQGSA